MNEELIWKIRAFVYARFGKTGKPPSAEVAARHFRMGAREVNEIYAELHRRHALFLDSETATIRMAWPFSGEPTRFRVQANGIFYWANCAWDSLGISAALHCDAEIEGYDALSNETISLAIMDGQPIHAGERIHFLTPFSRWYDDLVFT